MAILTYHGIKNKKNFEKQIGFLVRSGRNILTLSEFFVRYSDRTLTPRDVLITFDDGDYSLIENAVPVLREYGCPAVVFVITELIGTETPFWWDEIMYYTNDQNKVKEAKRVSNSERLELLRRIRANSEKPPFKARQLSVDDLKTMVKSRIDIANHSSTHPMMDQLKPLEIETELRESKEFLKHNGFPFYDMFAYPNGNFNDETEAILTREKMRLAFLFDHKVNKRTDNPYRISRLSVNDTTPLWKYKFILSGWHSRMLPFTKAIGSLMR